MGLVGHFDLYILRLDSKMMQFKCATCGTLWTRTAKSEESLVWSNSESEMRGLPVPGWKARGRIED
jgi:hypothetical protein